MANVVYNSTKGKLMDGTIDLDSDTIKVALYTSTYTPDIDTDIFFDDLTNEVTGTGYTAGGEELGSKTVTVDTTNNRAEFDAADTTWSTATITARGAVVYQDTGTPATSALICYIDFSTDKTSTSGDFKIAYNAEGILQLA